MDIFGNKVLWKLHKCEFTFWLLQNCLTIEAATGGAPVKKVSLIAIFTTKHLLWSLFFNKVARVRSVKRLKKRLQRKYFPVNFAKYLRTPFLPNTSGHLFLLIFFVKPDHLLKIMSFYKETAVSKFQTLQNCRI